MFYTTGNLKILHQTFLAKHLCWSHFNKFAKSDSTSATRNKGILHPVIFLQRTTSATNNEQILKQITSDFLQRSISATSNERFFASSSEQILYRVTSDFFERVTSDFL